MSIVIAVGLAVGALVGAASLVAYVLNWATNRQFRGPQTRGERLLARVLPYKPYWLRYKAERRYHEERERTRAAQHRQEHT